MQFKINKFGANKSETRFVVLKITATPSFPVLSLSILSLQVSSLSASLLDDETLFDSDSFNCCSLRATGFLLE
jgi:hypothetical protein